MSSSSPSSLTSALQQCVELDPPCFTFNSEYIQLILSKLSLKIVRSVALSFVDSVPLNQRNKDYYIRVILDDISSHVSHFSSLSFAQLGCEMNVTNCRLTTLYEALHIRYGKSIASTMSFLPTRWSPPDSIDGQCGPPWCSVPPAILHKYIGRCSNDDINAICHIYSQRLPRSRLQKCELLGRFFFRRSYNLYNIPDDELWHHYFAAIPVYKNELSSSSREQICSEILSVEYGVVALAVFEAYISTSSTSSKNSHLLAGKEKRRATKAQNIQNICLQLEKDIASWPSQIPSNVIFDCLREYCKRTNWQLPSVCCVCSRQRDGILMHNVKIPLDDNEDCLSLFSLLLITDPFIIQQTTNHFVFEDE